MILSICELPEFLKVVKIVKIVITIIKIVVPILLMISAMIDLVKAVTNAELNKMTKPIIYDNKSWSLIGGEVHLFVSDLINVSYSLWFGLIIVKFACCNDLCYLLCNINLLTIKIIAYEKVYFYPNGAIMYICGKCAEPTSMRYAAAW